MNTNHKKVAFIYKEMAQVAIVAFVAGVVVGTVLCVAARCQLNGVVNAVEKCQ